MIKHIVMWRLRASAEGADRAENAARMKEILEALPAKIPEIGRLEVGMDVSGSESAYDIVLCAEFDSADALERYQEHDAHLKAAEFIQKVREDRASVDYEVR
jgi:hypothetical protein